MNTNDTKEKSSKNFAIVLISIGVLSIFVQAVGTCNGYIKFKTWPRTSGIYTGKVSIGSPGRNTMPSCSHSYDFDFQGQKNTGTQLAECKYFFYGNQEVGKKYDIAYDPKNGKNVISLEVLFGLDLYRLLSLCLIPCLTGFGFFIWKKERFQKK